MLAGAAGAAESALREKLQSSAYNIRTRSQWETRQEPGTVGQVQVHEGKRVDWQVAHQTSSKAENQIGKSSDSWGFPGSWHAEQAIRSQVGVGPGYYTIRCLSLYGVQIRR